MKLTGCWACGGPLPLGKTRYCCRLHRNHVMRERRKLHRKWHRWT